MIAVVPQNKVPPPHLQDKPYIGKHQCLSMAGVSEYPNVIPRFFYLCRHRYRDRLAWSVLNGNCNYYSHPLLFLAVLLSPAVPASPWTIIACCSLFPINTCNKCSNHEPIRVHSTPSTPAYHPDPLSDFSEDLVPRLPPAFDQTWYTLSSLEQDVTAVTSHRGALIGASTNGAVYEQYGNESTQTVALGNQECSRQCF